MFSSIPLKSLCKMTEDQELQSVAATLSHSSTISFNIGLRGPLRPEFEGIHWLYVPDRSIPFYRVGFYSNIGDGTCAPGRSSIYVEVGLPSEAVDRTNLVHDLQPRIIQSLEELGWIDSQDVVCVVMHVMRHAYVHHTPQRNWALDFIRGRLREACVVPIGRYGLWDYTSMEDSMESARAAVLEAGQ
jgi:protoporphyrinogen oxidase